MFTICITKIKNDKEVVLSAITNDTNALFFSKRLFNDRECYFHMIKHNNKIDHPLHKKSVEYKFYIYFIKISSLRSIFYKL